MAAYMVLARESIFRSGHFSGFLTFVVIVFTIMFIVPLEDIFIYLFIYLRGD